MRQTRLFFASPLMLARLLGAGAGFLTQLILARVLPPEDLGIFFAATSFAAMAGLAVTQGYPGVAQRFITRYQERGRQRLLQGFVGQAERETILVTLTAVAAIAGCSIAWPGAAFDSRVVIAATALGVASASSFTLYGAFASAQRRFFVAQLPETLIRPVLFFPSVLILAAVAAGDLGAGAVTSLYTAISALLALTQYAIWSPQRFASKAIGNSRIARRWRREGVTLTLAILFATSFADLAILFASPFLGAAALAPFGVALKISLLVGFAVQIAHQVALPDLAEANERRDVSGITRALFQATVFPSLVTGGCLFASLLAGEWLLGLFGPEYIAAKWPLVILLAAQLLRALAGPAQSLLMLKGAQGTNAAICVACSAILLLSDAALIPPLGLVGASIAVFITVAIWVGAGSYALWERAGLRVDFLSLIHADGLHVDRIASRTSSVRAELEHGGAHVNAPLVVTKMNAGAQDDSVDQRGPPNNVHPSVMGMHRAHLDRP